MSSVSTIKKAQKESALFKSISRLFLETMLDDPRLQGLFITRVALSDDKGFCSVYFYSPEGQDLFDQKLEFLKLYKPSLRKALAEKLPGRYTPEIVFKFDDHYEKVLRIEQLIDKVNH